MTTKKQDTIFVVWAYALFWGLLIIAIGVMSAMPELSAVVFPVVQVIGTWAPTAALLILFKKLYPDMTVKAFLQNAFKERLNYKLLAVITIVEALIVSVTLGYGAFAKGVSFFSLLDITFAGFLITLFSGAMGEEFGWRGHLQQAMEKKHNVLKSCLIVGVIWTFWHALTWVNYISMPYLIPLNMLSTMANAFIIGICYHRCRNLLVPMWIHFVMNILVNWAQGTLADYFVLYVLLNVLVAIGYVAWYLKSSKRETAAA